MGYRSGRVSNDGNGMVGGYWWACDFTAKARVYLEDVIDRLATVAACLPEEFEIEAEFEAGEDTSVGLGQYCEMIDEASVPEDVLKLIDEAKISDAWKDALKAVLEAYAEELDSDKYDMEEALAD